ncbi:hypothetical protein Salat_2085200 [Sesamum alatum]|uniref:Uncharacterized protein n=1 Tax=Sesamum alatum TaxID=300844 RepID=A0AAE1Y154_9LAMI|nr:hypothetical protein Salat_2085200 [Sesamum alatum]
MTAPPLQNPNLVANAHPPEPPDRTEGQYFPQPVIYERSPKYCEKYRHLGHGVEESHEGKEQRLEQPEDPISWRSVIDKWKAKRANVQVLAENQHDLPQSVNQAENAQRGQRSSANVGSN